MPLQSRSTVDIPDVTVPTWLFSSPLGELSDQPFVFDPLQPEGRFLTFSSYRRNAQRFAAGLRLAGLQTGDRVLYVSGNSLAFYAVYMGTLMAGGVFSGISPTKTSEEIAYQATDTECRFILSSPEAYGKCEEALKGIDIPAKHVYLVDREPLYNALSRDTPTTPYRDWTELLGDKSQGLGFDWTQYCTDPNQLAVLTYTSGSTGRPKGVITSHRNLVANSTQWMHAQLQDPNEREIRESTSWVGWLPMIYVFGQTQYLLTGPKRGIRNYLMEVFDLNRMIDFVEQYRTTELFGIPSIVLGLVNSPKARNADLTCITSVHIGGAPMKRPICERLEKTLGHPGLITGQGWGMTELTCIAVGWYPPRIPPPVSVGELLPNCEGKIMSLDGTTELGPNERGEVYIRGPIITMGYWKKPEQTKIAYQDDGWFRTGDLGYYDDQGMWYIVDRIRELITTPQGHHVVPSEIESIVFEVPGVVDAGVIAVDVKHSKSRELRAFVVLDPSTGRTVQDVQAFLAEKLDSSQQLTAGVFAVEAIPRLPGAKVDTNTLRGYAVTELQS